MSDSDIGSLMKTSAQDGKLVIGGCTPSITLNLERIAARLVVADIREDDGLYMLGISSEGEAQRHAVINHNPFLGRVTMDGLSVYENGDPQAVFNFPWMKVATWSFRLLGEDWSAKYIMALQWRCPVVTAKWQLVTT